MWHIITPEYKIIENACLYNNNIVPAPVCDTATASGGNITITWSFNHTGGLPLTDLTISYVFREGTTDITRNGPPVGLADTTADIQPMLVAGQGLVYTPMVTATNEQGSSTVQCPSVELDVANRGSTGTVN